MSGITDAGTALQAALDNGELWLAYQPQIAIASGRLVGVEALLRWEDPERGTVPPVEFIGLAESSGLILPIGAWALQEASRQTAAWALAFPNRVPLRVSVNVSPVQFTEGLSATVAAALDDSGLDPRLLCLEVTESTVMDDVADTITTLNGLKALGITVSIDDFGTGYSSLAYLRRLPLDELKVDKSFVDGLGDDPEDTAIVAAIVATAHALDLAVVAEGVETERQLEALRALGCEHAQGFLIGRPQRPEALADLLVVEAEGSWAGRALVTGDGHGPGVYRSDRAVIIDDTADVRLLARMSLAAAGFEVHEAGNAREGVALVSEVRPDCVVLDVRMPDIDGFAVCRMLRAGSETANCTIVMLTSEASAEGKIQAFSAGADDYIVKPFAPRELVSRVEAAMRRRNNPVAS